MSVETGTEATRSFYNQQGWAVTETGQTVDGELFGVKEDGPIRAGLYEKLQKRIGDALSAAGDKLNLIECGCGGAPERRLQPHCNHYTGVDFSETGLILAANTFSEAPVPAVFQTADICALPYSDGSFDAVYSAHVVYHIADPAAQRRALTEMVRVTRPGGAIVVIAANPRPLLFPLRAAMRLAATMPVIAPLMRRLKGPSPIPYNPQTIGWMQDALSGCASVEVHTAGMASTWVNQRVSERRYPGKALWQIIGLIEGRAPKLAARLGNYVVFTCRR